MADYTARYSDTAWRDLRQVLANRKYCDTGCSYFEDCPLQPLSYLDKDRHCLMGVYGEPLQRTFLNLHRRGEAGLISEMRRVLFLVARKVETTSDLKSIERYFDLLVKLHKVEYGDKGVSDSDAVPTLDVTISRVGGSVPVESVGVEVPRDLLVDEQLRDPDSLFYNPEYRGAADDSGS